MQHLIDTGVMKQFMADGVPMCSYRTIAVHREEGHEERITLDKDPFLNPLTKP